MPTTFFNQNGDYYETITEVETPEGHSIAPKRPDGLHEWDGDAWVYIEPTVSTDPHDYDLSPAQFKWLLAISGLKDVLETVLAFAKANDAAIYAELELNLARSRFLFSKTMELIAQMDGAGDIPDGADVSEATIGTLWMQAKEK